MSLSPLAPAGWCQSSNPSVLQDPCPGLFLVSSASHMTAFLSLPALCRFVFCSVWRPAFFLDFYFFFFFFYNLWSCCLCFIVIFSFFLYYFSFNLTRTLLFLILGSGLFRFMAIYGHFYFNTSTCALEKSAIIKSYHQRVW